MRHMILMLAAVGVVGGVALSKADVFTWGGGDGDWHDAAQWDKTAVPGDGDAAVVWAGTVSLTNITESLASFTLNGGTLVFSNWSTRLTATAITLSGGAVTCVGPVANGEMTNRVWLSGATLTIGAAARIDVNEKGYKGGNNSAGHGPGGGAKGGGYASGGSHGGYGGVYAETLTRPYGTPEEPLFVGSGGGSGGAAGRLGGNGGGAVRLDFSGTVTVDGAITANGGTTASIASAGGAGGGIRIACETLAGSGSLSANGANGVTYAGGGGGGRIAIYYDVAKQGAVDVAISAAPGLSPFGTTGVTGHLGAHGGMGSVWLPNDVLLPTTVTADRFSGAVYGIDSWSPATLTVNDTVLQFPSDGFTLDVAGPLTVAGPNARLTMGGTNMFGIGARWPQFFNEQPVSLQAASLTLTNGAKLVVFSAPTNGAADSVGAVVNIAGDVDIFANSWLYPASHPVNGGAPLLRAGNLDIRANGGINADTLGFRGGAGAHYNGYGPGGGTGPSGGGYATAGGHGGRGGASFTYPTTFAPTYGDYRRPLDPGSGGGRQGQSAPQGGGGGGAVRIEAQNKIVMEGVITANGFDPNPYGNPHHVIGAGAGGSVFLKCHRLAGNGAITAKGGNNAVNNGNSSAAGGGRVALWYSYSGDNIAVDVSGGTNTANTAYCGEAGSVYRHTLPWPGTIMLVR